MSIKKSDKNPLLIDLALQGRGWHGAFTWGVLDRPLDEPTLRIEAISGTPAGAMNAPCWPTAGPKAGGRRTRGT